jgi:hypothetical protein
MVMMVVVVVVVVLVSKERRKSKIVWGLNFVFCGSRDVRTTLAYRPYPFWD